MFHRKSEGRKDIIMELNKHRYWVGYDVEHDGVLGNEVFAVGFVVLDRDDGGRIVEKQYVVNTQIAEQWLTRSKSTQSYRECQQSDPEYKNNYPFWVWPENRNALLCMLNKNDDNDISFNHDDCVRTEVRSEQAFATRLRCILDRLHAVYKDVCFISDTPGFDIASIDIMLTGRALNRMYKDHEGQYIGSSKFYCASGIPPFQTTNNKLIRHHPVDDAQHIVMSVYRQWKTQGPFRVMTEMM